MKEFINSVILSLPLFFENDGSSIRTSVVQPLEEEVITVEYKAPETENYEATFYTAFCPTGCIGITASGYDVSKTIYWKGLRILAAPKEVPLYTVYEVLLEDGERFKGIVLDRGGDITKGRIDILVDNRNYAYSKGRQVAYLKEIK